MANTLTAANPKIWAKEMQPVLRTRLVAKGITNMELKTGLTYGASIARPYASEVSTGTYVPGTDMTITDITITDDVLTIGTKKYAAVRVDDLEAIQSKFDLVRHYSEEIAHKLAKDVDTVVLAHGTDGNETIEGDDGSIGGAAGAFAVTAANVSAVAGAIKTKLMNANARVHKGIFWVVRPETAELIEQYAISTGFNTADAALKNGYAGNFRGIEIYVSNNLPASKHLAGVKGSIDLVMQKEVGVEFRDEPRQTATNVLGTVMFGSKVFNNMAAELLDVQVTN